jgi:hypothetical protein
MKKERLQYVALKWVAGIISAGAALAAVGILASQTNRWLKTATWTPYTIADAVHDWGFAYPFLPRLLGVQEIIDNVFAWPASMAYIAIALAAGFIWLHATEAEAELNRAERLAKIREDFRPPPETLEDLAQHFEDTVRAKKR